MIYSREYETMLKEDLVQLQLERLQATLNRVYRNVAFYKQSFDQHQVDIESIKSLDDLKRLPFTTKDDLRKAYPYDMFAVPLRDIVRIHSTSGTTAKPIVVGYTRNDISIWASLGARVLTAAGITSQDFVQVAFHYGLFTGGFGFHYGAEKIGASVIPSSTEDVRKQITILKDYKTTALVSTPGYALHIAVRLEEQKIHPEELYLKKGIFGAEPWSESLRSQIEEKLHIEAYDNYGLTEILGPGVAFECPRREGLHVYEDHFMVEIIDPDTLEPLGFGEEGELVFPTITKQGFPLIRYRTGDVSSLIEAPCECGRTLVRMNRISGRTDDMIIVEGNNVFPMQIEQILLDMKGAAPHYQIVLKRQDGLDAMEINLELSEQLASFDEIRGLQKFGGEVAERIRRELGISARINLVEPMTIRRSEGGKLQRVVDLRE